MAYWGQFNDLLREPINSFIAGTITGIIISIVVGFLYWWFPRSPKPKIKLSVKQTGYKGATDVYTIINTGDLEANIERVILRHVPAIWLRWKHKPTEIPCCPTSAAELANGETGMPRLSRPLTFGKFVEVSISACRLNSIQNALKQAAATLIRGKWYLDIHLRQLQKPIIIPVKRRGEAPQQP